MAAAAHPSRWSCALLSLLLGGSQASQVLTRRAAVRSAFASAAGLAGVAAFPIAVHSADGQVATAGRSLSTAELKRKLLEDISEKRFMVTGNLSPELYASEAKFTDEIDTYDLKSYVRGTGQLFDGSKSTFKLVGDLAFDDNDRTIRYRFDEILSFKIPLEPKVRVSGEVVLKRGDDGLITSYREYWDQSVPSTLVDLFLDGTGIKKAPALA